MKKIKVRLKDRSYDILIGRGLLRKCGVLLKRLGIGEDALCITNSSLLTLYKHALKSSLEGSGVSVRFETVPDSERAKTAGVATELIKKISAYDKLKKVFIINFGGGVIGDLGGFVASVYKRGIPYVQIPTTLLAQVDSAIGGKVAVDLPVAKNLMGAFYQPRAVISDIDLIRSLPGRQIKAGLAEVVKYGVIKDPRLFGFLEKNSSKVLACDRAALEYVITASSRIKSKLVEKDEFDRTGDRAILNFGHTIGHAIEAAAGYSKRYNHGEAIAIGMVAACSISESLGMISAKESAKIKLLIADLGLPTAARGVNLRDVYRAHLHDKKFTCRRNRFVLPVRIGKVRVVEGVSDAVIKKVLKEVLI